jgi:hypothetical protein
MASTIRASMQSKGIQIMATNPPSGDGHRNGAVKNRSQVRSPLNDKETKRDDSSGKFMAQKKTGKFKGVRRED